MKKRKKKLRDPITTTKATSVQKISELPDKADGNLKMLSFQVPLEWHSTFKMTALSHRMSMKELLFEAFFEWKRRTR